MAMYHHDSRGYETAANEARDYLRRSIQKNSARAAQGMRELQDRVISDQLMPLADVKFGINESLGLTVNGLRVTPQAFGQLCQRADLHVAHGRKLLTSDNPLRRALLVDTLETMAATSEEHGLTMLRSVNGRVHGVVTDAFKRMDMPLIVGMLAQHAHTAALLPVQCDMSATKVYVKAMMPRLYGAEYGEAIAFGIEMRGSDFGFGQLEVDAFAERVWCTNRARMTLGLGRGFRKAHRGARITADTFALSDDTRRAQALALSGELQDAVRGLLAPDAIDAYVGAIGACFAEGQRGGKFDAQKELDALIERRRISERQAKFVSEVYSSKDRDVVPELDGRWKLAQAIAYASQHAADLDLDDRADLEYLAGEVVAAAPKNALPAYAS